MGMYDDLTDFQFGTWGCVSARPDMASLTGRWSTDIRCDRCRASVTIHGEGMFIQTYAVDRRSFERDAMTRDCWHDQIEVERMVMALQSALQGVPPPRPRGALRETRPLYQRDLGVSYDPSFKVPSLQSESYRYVEEMTMRRMGEQLQQEVLSALALPAELMASEPLRITIPIRVEPVKPKPVAVLLKPGQRKLKL
jgi:hypothetical protein